MDTTPKPKAQYNFTDPESKIMKVSNKGFDQCGNAQAVANEKQIIIAADVTPQANDKRQVVPMVEQSQENLQAAGVKEKIRRGGKKANACPPITTNSVRGWRGIDGRNIIP